MVLGEVCVCLCVFWGGWCLVQERFTNVGFEPQGEKGLFICSGWVIKVKKIWSACSDIDKSWLVTKIKNNKVTRFSKMRLA